MRIARHIFLAFAVLFCSMSFAAPVSRQQAEQKAKAFLSQHGKALYQAEQVMTMVATQQAQSAGMDEYYVFNIGQQQGFVMVSGDDRTPAILGYVTEGSFVESEMPENMRLWLQEYADQIAYLNSHDDTPAVAPYQLDEHAAIEPLLTCNWNQGYPYNMLCPPDGSYRSVTGCVATAMAQVLYYHKHPASTTATIPAYTTSSKGISVNAIAPAAIDWSNMCDSYSGGVTEAQRTAVARLMQLCGAAVQMDYASHSSGTSSSLVPIALKNYFDYDQSAVLAERSAYCVNDWNNMVYNELASNRPVYYSGSSVGGGHAFVIDGYDQQGLFHVNWGWGGSCNGYFLLSILDPYDYSGIGSSSSNDGYSYSQFALIGARPNAGGTDTSISRLSSTTINTTTNSVVLENGTYSVTVSLDYWNNTQEYHDFDLGLGLFNESGDLLSAFQYYGYIPMNIGVGYPRFDITWDIPELSDGTYRICGISRVSGTEQWYCNSGGELRYIEATVSNGVMSLSGSNIICNFNITGSTVIDGNTIVQATLHNTGSYYGENLFLLVDSQIEGNQYFEVAKNATVTHDYSFQPTTAGEKHIILAYRAYDYNDGWKLGYYQLADTTITITETEPEPEPEPTPDSVYVVTVYRADGTHQELEVSSGFTVADDALTIDLTAFLGDSIVANANPNTLYMVNRDTLPVGLEGRNILKNGICEQLSLTDGYSFYTPFAFTANEARYSRVFTVGADGTSGWSTLSLPFDVTSVKYGKRELSWFLSDSDTGKYFWLKEFTHDDGATLYFDHASQLRANVPYIIAVPGSSWGNQWNLVNKKITFYGSNAEIIPTTPSSAVGLGYSFEGYSCDYSVSDGYVMNAQGTTFQYASQTTMPAFRACFRALGGAGSRMLNIVADSHTSGIVSVDQAVSGATHDAVYTLQGQRADNPCKGIYVQGGRKVVVK